MLNAVGFLLDAVGSQLVIGSLSLVLCSLSR